MQNFKAIKYIRLSYTDDKTVESNSVSNPIKLIDLSLRSYRGLVVSISKH